MSQNAVASVPDSYLSVTEVSGTEITRQQLVALVRRYRWAGEFCNEKDVLEVACGAGPGLLYLNQIAKKVVAGDVSEKILRLAELSVGDRVELHQFDAQALPFSERSFDVLLLFEAIYYLASASKFLNECRRVLRPGGTLLIVTANKDLYDFNPSPFSHKYYGATELVTLLRECGFEAHLFAADAAAAASFRERMLRPVKKLAVRLNLVPRTMKGKKWLKRIVFGSLVPMPSSIAEVDIIVDMPAPISSEMPDRTHKVIYCAAHYG